MNTIELPAIMDNLEEGIDFILAGIEQAGVDQKMLFQLRLACEEVIVNVINYAYPDSKGSMQISYDISDNELEVVVSDSGVHFNPINKEDPDLSIPLEDRKIGGLGIFLVRNIMDQVEYSREDGRNILTMRKVLK